MRAIHRRIATPLVTDLRVIDASVDADTVAPQPVPDLFPGAPLLLTGRLTGDADSVTVVGKAADGSEWRRRITAHASDNAALGAIWARARIRDLEDHYAIGRTEALADLEQRIIATSLEFGVLSKFTAFVAVDSRVVNEGGQPRQLTQPVDVPAGWASPSPRMPMLATRMSAGSADIAMPLSAMVQAPRAASPAEAADEVQVEYGPRRERGRAKAKRTSVDRELKYVSPAVSIPDSVQEFAERALAKLLESEPLGFSERVKALVELAESIGDALAEFVVAGLDQRETTVLANFAAGRAKQIGNPAELQKRWSEAVHLLERLIGNPVEPQKRRSFWKR
jgi:Ca-activated chloride channel family protein